MQRAWKWKCHKLSQTQIANFAAHRESKSFAGWSSHSCSSLQKTDSKSSKGSCCEFPAKSVRATFAHAAAGNSLFSPALACAKMSCRSCKILPHDVFFLKFSLENESRIQSGGIYIAAPPESNSWGNWKRGEGFRKYFTRTHPPTRKCLLRITNTSTAKVGLLELLIIPCYVTRKNDWREGGPWISYVLGRRSLCATILFEIIFPHFHFWWNGFPPWQNGRLCLCSVSRALNSLTTIPPSTKATLERRAHFEPALGLKLKYLRIGFCLCFVLCVHPSCFNCRPLLAANQHLRQDLLPLSSPLLLLCCSGSVAFC